MRQGRVEQDKGGDRNNERSTIGRLLWNVDVRKCIALINGVKASWLSRGPSSSERIAAIKDLAALNEPYYDDVLLGATRDSDHQVREAAAVILADRVRRNATVRGVEVRLSRFGIRTSDPVFWANNLPTNDARALISLASVNSSGYVRQAALKQMTADRHAAYVPFILPRLGDWVPQVRDQAHRSLKRYREAQFRKGFLEVLSELEALLTIRRIDLNEVYQDTMSWIVSGTEATKLLDEIKSVGETSRFRVVRFMLKHLTCGEVLMRTLLSDRNFLVRLSALRHLIERKESWVGHMLLMAMRDEFAPVRSLALRGLISSGEASQDVLYSGLIDRALAIRDQSRKALAIDDERLVAFYREQITSGDQVVGGILGLADIGKAGDAEVIHRFVSHPDKDVRSAVLYALRKLDPSSARAEAGKLIVDPNKRIRALAESVLLEHHDRGVVERGRELLLSSDIRHRIVGLSLLSKFGGWEPLADLLTACSDTSPRVAEQAWVNLDAWTAYARRLFSEPATGDIERARNALALVRSKLTALTHSQKSTLDEVAVFLN